MGFIVAYSFIFWSRILTHLNPIHEAMEDAAIDAPLLIAFDLLPSGEVEVGIVTEARLEFGGGDDVALVGIRVEEMAFLQFTFLMEVAEDREEWGDARSAGDEQSGTLVLDRTPRVTDQQVIANLK
jgi:hypothetical protein